MRDEKEGRKKQARSKKQTNKAKQHSTPKTVTFPIIIRKMSCLGHMYMYMYVDNYAYMCTIYRNKILKKFCFGFLILITFIFILYKVLCRIVFILYYCSMIL